MSIIQITTICLNVLCQKAIPRKKDTLMRFYTNDPPPSDTPYRVKFIEEHVSSRTLRFISTFPYQELRKVVRSTLSGVGHFLYQPPV